LNGKKYDETRAQHKDSLIISLVGYGHTDLYIKEKRSMKIGGYNPDDPVIGYDRMVGGVHWPINHKPYQLISRSDQQPVFKFINNAGTQIPPILSEDFFKSLNRSHNLDHLRSFLHNQIFKEEKEKKSSIDKIDEYATNPNESAKDNILIGRFPKDLVKRICEHFEINMTPDDIITSDSSYRGPNDNITHVALSLTPAALDKIIKLNESEFSQAISDIKNDIAKLYKEKSAHLDQNIFFAGNSEKNLLIKFLDSQIFKDGSEKQSSINKIRDYANNSNESAKDNILIGRFPKDLVKRICEHFEINMTPDDIITSDSSYKGPNNNVTHVAISLTPKALDQILKLNKLDEVTNNINEEIKKFYKNEVTVTPRAF